MTSLPSVSVVIPVLNGEETIGNLLHALDNQLRFTERPEIIVVDNGSSDGTVDIVSSTGVKLLREQKRGASAARNRGLLQARGEVIAHLDADTLPTHRWLHEIVQPFADPSVLLVAGRNVSYRPQTAAERYINKVGLYEADDVVIRPVLPFVPSLNMAVRKHVALAVGGWAEDVLWSEDVDFSHRILRKFGSDIIYQRAAVIFHRNRSTDDQLRRQAFNYGQGAAAMYLRYPDQVRWTPWNTLMVGARFAQRTALPYVLEVGRRLGLSSPDDAEFARYHRTWSREYWKGFFSMYRSGVYRIDNAQPR